MNKPSKLTVTAGIIGGLILIGCGGAGGIANGNQSPPSTISTEAITLAEFDRITTGMTHPQVVEIVGSPGRVSSELAGSKTYTFDGGTFTTAVVTFDQTGAVTSKSQFGLK